MPEEKPKTQPSKIGVLDPFRAIVDGEEVLVDHRTFTMRERRESRVALAKLTAEDGLLADEGDVMAALLWVVLRRSSPELTFAEIVDSLELGTLASAEAAQNAEADTSDPEA